MKIFISAAEISADSHAARWLSELQSKVSEPIEWVGIGGPKLRRMGQKQWYPAESFLGIGFSEILKKIIFFRRTLKDLAARIRAEKPDAIIVFDYPDFHFRLLESIQDLQIPSAWAIPPKVWVWRSSRAEVLSNLVQKVFCIFPFEPEWHPKGVYIGNPTFESLKESVPKVGKERRGLAILPGSRPAELKFHLSLMIEVGLEIAPLLKYPELRISLPEGFERWMERPRIEALVQRAARKGVTIHVGFGDSVKTLEDCEFGLIKSGTSTLEAAILDLPFVVVYKTPRLTEWIYKTFVKNQLAVSLPNLLLKEKLFPEVVGADVDAEGLIEVATRLLQNRGELERLRKGAEKVRELLKGEASLEPMVQWIQGLIKK